jgi:hypothetical protein
MQLSTEGRENRDMGEAAPLSGVSLNLQKVQAMIFLTHCGPVTQICVFCVFALQL